MMPVVSHTQITAPTQVSLVATPMQGTAVMRVPSTDVAPTVQNAAITPDNKGSGGYTPMGAAPVSTSPAALTMPLSVLIPASFSTNSASLGAGSMFATLLLSQEGAGGAEILEVYEAMVAAAQVKYKPSNAALPQPENNSLFSRMLAEGQQNTRSLPSAQQMVQEAATQAPTQAAMNTPSAKPTNVASSGKRQNEPSAQASERSMASSAYSGTLNRNRTFLEEVPAVESLVG